MARALPLRRPEPRGEPGRPSEAGPSAVPARPIVAVVGNPNTGKSTLFNALTGMRQKVANYPGVTVEKHVGYLRLEEPGKGGIRDIELVDLPGMYSLAAHSPDELVSLEVLLGRPPATARPDAVLVSVDASNLQRNLYLVSQVLELGLPVVVALNMTDLAARRGVPVDAGELERRLGARVVPMVATAGLGLDELRAALAEAVGWGEASRVRLLPWLEVPARRLADELGAEGADVARLEVERAMIDAGAAAEERLRQRCGPEVGARLEVARREAIEAAGARETGVTAPGAALAALEAQSRYGWAAGIVAAVTGEGEAESRSLSDRLDHFLSHPLWGSLAFLVIMGTLFQAVFTWATPVMDGIDAVTTGLGEWLGTLLPEGAIRSLVVDGVIAGVGSVVVFLPQIVFLFAFILFLEDTGYMARAAFLMDRLMRGAGLSGQSFIPMLSSFACAVPGILGTRVIPDRRDRLATILAAPFMTCSARLPVYALLIAAFVPERHLGPFSVRGLVLLGLYLLGILGGVVTALVLKRTLLRGPTPTFLMELPPYRWPDLKSVLLRLWERAGIFLRRAGTVIFSVAVVVWALAYFPRPEAVGERFEALRAETAVELSGAALGERLEALRDEEASVYLEQSYLGRLGHAIVPVFEPLGWDWKVSAAVLAAFPAREVVVAVLGTLYAVGSDVDPEDEGLVERLRTAEHPDGGRVFDLPMALGLMVFFAFCLQCVSTVAIIRRETNSWRWPAFAWVYMTGVAYVGALVTRWLAEWWLA